MDYERFLQLLQIEQPEVFVERLLRAISEIYRFNADRYEPELDDLQVFGFQVYRNSWAAIEDAVENISGVQTARPNNSLEVVVAGHVRFHVYRGGNDETYDIYSYDLSTGTATKASLPRINAGQLSLFDSTEPGEDNLWRLRELVVVHAGNPQIGLTGVWVGAPLDDARWAWVLPLYQRPSGGEELESDVPPEISPFDSLSEPDLDIASLDAPEEVAESE